MNNKDTLSKEFDILNEDFTDSILSEEQLKETSTTIIEGLNIDQEENSIPVDSTLLSENNPANNQNCESVFSNQSKTFKTENLKNALKYVAKEYESPLCESYYNEISEYHGIVESINDEEKSFIATLYLKSNSEKMISVEFSMDDVQYESEKSLIKVGAPLIWLVGQETGLLLRENQLKQGPRVNISKFRFRRTIGLSHKQVQIAKEEADEWTRFFNECQTED